MLDLGKWKSVPDDVKNSIILWHEIIMLCKMMATLIGIEVRQ